eukprot:7024851-Pyramimonas_sp.AAC.1
MSTRTTTRTTTRARTTRTRPQRMPTAGPRTRRCGAAAASVRSGEETGNYRCCHARVVFAISVGLLGGPHRDGRIRLSSGRTQGNASGVAVSVPFNPTSPLGVG